jgi:hypothetical protein
MNSIKYLYGLPIYLEKIDPKTYQKNKILSQIKKNYSISHERNNWSKNSHLKTDIHHSILDDENKKFNKINYYNLVNEYKKIIDNFFKKTNLKNSFNFKYNIVNYTCSNQNSFMIPHIHGDCSFSLVHYISFDKKQHIPTIFKSPYYFSNLLPNNEKLKNIFDCKFEENSWLNKEWVFDTEEDDVVIFPAILEHYVRNLNSEKLRITISVNISIENLNG